MDTEIVLAILFWTGVILSLLFKIPKIKNWYESKTKAFKTYFMLGLNVLAGLLILGVACAGIGGIVVPVTCDLNGIGGVIVALGTIIGGNQVAYMLPAGIKKT